MRDSILTSLLLASATLTSASRLECLYLRSRELANGSPCGDEAAISYCLSHLESLPNAITRDVERCFVWAGCTVDESKSEAARVLGECENPTNELRVIRRQIAAEGGDSAHDNSAFAPAAAKDAILAGRDPLLLITAMNHPRQAEATGNPSSPGQCFSQESTETTACPIATAGESSGRRMPCVPTVLVSVKCIEGLICKSDMQGNPSCMFKHSSLDLGGIILAIIFASAIVISVVTICFMCCRERREHRRIERAAEAARIASEAKTQATVAAKRPGTAVTGGVSGPSVEGQPLMYQGGGGGASTSPGAQTQPGQVPMQQGYGAGNPFADAQNDGHPLR